eukprot:TRINITY_DN2576_c0_g1_i1.p1 TRINITY_DN2576_c0_g1~~TRINITY_DN2576_c0_g1_i1.p1  ORF type:complete len:163 (-),score=22.94 TRINITY_DN2576_c0_g1_i1:126-614(-)
MEENESTELEHHINGDENKANQTLSLKETPTDLQAYVKTLIEINQLYRGEEFHSFKNELLELLQEGQHCLQWLVAKEKEIKVLEERLSYTLKVGDALSKRRTGLSSAGRNWDETLESSRSSTNITSGVGSERTSTKIGLVLVNSLLTFFNLFLIVCLLRRFN